MMKRGHLYLHSLDAIPAHEACLRRFGLFMLDFGRFRELEADEPLDDTFGLWFLRVEHDVRDGQISEGIAHCIGFTVDPFDLLESGVGSSGLPLHRLVVTWLHLGMRILGWVCQQI